MVVMSRWCTSGHPVVSSRNGSIPGNGLDIGLTSSVCQHGTKRLFDITKPTILPQVSPVNRTDAASSTPVNKILGREYCSTRMANIRQRPIKEMPHEAA